MKLIYHLFSGIYGLVVLIRNLLYDLKVFRSTAFEIPVISVGNITVGGTGKTPHVEYLVQLLKNHYRVATLSRGYKRKTKGFRLVETTSVVEECGDEPLQMKQKFNDILVAVCENRVTGVSRLLELNDKPDLVLLDDAFQHRRITPGINILLADFTRPVYEDFLLPAGRLREGKIQVRRANMVVVTKCPEKPAPITRKIIKKKMNIRPYQSLFFSSFGYGIPEPVFLQANPQPNLRTTGILLVTGIASPQPLFDHLSSMATEIIQVIFPDHHFYKPADITFILNKFENLRSEHKIIVTTEKDAIRFRDMKELPSKIKDSVYFLPVHVLFSEIEKKEFDQRIISYVGKNKTNSKLHKRENKL